MINPGWRCVVADANADSKTKTVQRFATRNGKRNRELNRKSKSSAKLRH
jgi:hypothetical protein